MQRSASLKHRLRSLVLPNTVFAPASASVSTTHSHASIGSTPTDTTNTLNTRTFLSAAADSVLRASDRCYALSVPRRTPGPRTLATKAEEYDVIAVDAGLVRIEGYDAKGFLMNDVYMEGAVLCAGELAALWKVESLADISEDSLAMLLLMKPAPDTLGPELLIIGCGDRIEPLPEQLREYLASAGIAVECLDTGNAVSTFNILNQEGRKVAAAMLPGE